MLGILPWRGKCCQVFVCVVRVCVLGGEESVVCCFFVVVGAGSF
jgi:hypothetical protein